MSSEPVKKAPHKCGRETGHDGYQGVTKNVFVKYLPLSQTFGAGGDHVLLADFF